MAGMLSQEAVERAACAWMRTSMDAHEHGCARTLTGYCRFGYDPEQCIVFSECLLSCVAAAAFAEVPMAADGHPDLSGMWQTLGTADWDLGTMTCARTFLPTGRDRRHSSWSRCSRRRRDTL